jgi:nicotinic acid mononucleotide adenylyltransferase
MSSQETEQEKKVVVITYQGAFSPPTQGHKDGAKKLITAALTLHPDAIITLLFMPSNDVESKLSLNKQASMNKQASKLNKQGSNIYMSFRERFVCLHTIANHLLVEYYSNENVFIEVSRIEQDFVKDPPITSKTICTLMKVRIQFGPNAIIYLGIGADNMANMLDWAHSLAIPYPDDTDPIHASQLTSHNLVAKGDNNGEYYFKDYISGIFVLDRMKTDEVSVSNTNIGKTIEGIDGNVINIESLNYIPLNNTETTPKPIPIVRTTTWGRIDIVNVDKDMINKSYPNPIYLLDAPNPPGVSSSSVRNNIVNSIKIEGLVPKEITELPPFTEYVIRLKKSHSSTTESNGGNRNKTKRNKTKRNKTKRNKTKRNKTII